MMRSCFHCQQINRTGAFFCKHCGYALVCPRCRMLQDGVANYCDNCGQALAAGNMFAAIPLTEEQQQRLATLEESASSPTGRSSAAEATAKATSTRLDQFVPQELLTKLEAVRVSGNMTGERRIVTILFCDVKGSTAAAERLDPEEWTEIINGAFEHMIRPVYNYEGTLARLMGDAILAFFGAPIAHEDDAQRAILAGLDIISAMNPYRDDVKEKWGIDFDVRVGINTGMVVVGAVGSDLRMEYTAMGDAVNLAARMEQTAAPGTVQIAHDTYKLVAPLFDFEELGQVEIKGKALPIKTYRVLRPRETPGKLRGIAGSSLPLVGRENARKKLSTAMSRVLEGNGQIVTITGDVGLGKSRLIADMREEWRQFYPEASGDGEIPLLDSRWFETFSLSYQTTSPYGLFRNFIRQASGATPSDPPAILTRKLRAFISTTAPVDQLEPAVAVLETLFGLRQEGDTTLAGETFKSELFETITTLVSAWAGDKPGVIICDDIQWSDPASMALLVHLFKLIDRLPILFVNALRPDRRSPGWQVKGIADDEYPHRYTEVQLESLSQEESRALVGRLLDNDHLPDFLQEDIYTKAAGNPFFIEEIVREMMANGSVIPEEHGTGWQIATDFDRKQTTIPDSLQSMLTSRIDRLDEAQKHILQMAAVIGPSFYFRVLGRVIDSSNDGGLVTEEALIEHLGELQRLNLIVQVARLPELEYIFRQTLVHESAYKTILRRQRRLYHRQVGESMELLFTEQLGEHAIVLAHHFTEAGDDVRSLKYNTQAADTAYRLYANTEAVAHYSRALAAAHSILQKAAPEATVSVAQFTHLFEHRGRALELDSRIEEAVKNYEAMGQKALELGSKEMELAALMPLMTLYSTPTSIYDFEKGGALSQQALQLAQELDNQPAEAKILWNLLNMNRFAGRTRQALEYGERSLTLARNLNLRDQMAYCLNDLCHSYNRRGRYDKSKVALEESITIWRELDNLPMLADSLSTASYVHNITGDYDEAIAFSEEARQISLSIKNIWGISYSQWMIGMVYWQRGTIDKAIRVMEESINYAEKAGFVVAQVYTRANLAVLYAELGAIEQGLEIAREAVKFAEISPLQLRSSALAQIARINLMNGDVAAAERALEEIRAKNYPVHLNQPDMASIAEIELFFHRGDYQKTGQFLEQRLDALRAHGMKAHVPETTFLLGKAYQAANQPDKAISNLEEGLAVARSMEARWGIWQILATLADLASVEQAGAYRVEAQEIIQFIAGNVSQANLRQTFLDRPEVQKLMATHPAKPVKSD